MLAEGPGVGGGGYSYRRGAIPLTVKAIDRIKNFINKITQEEFDIMQLKWPFKIANKSDLLMLLNQIEIQKETQLYTNTIIGMEPLMANFEGSNVSNGKIVLQPIFLTTFNREDSKSDEDLIIRILLHEGSHLFGIGLNNDDDSFNYSKALTAKILKTEEHSIPEKINSTSHVNIFIVAQSENMTMTSSEIENFNLTETNQFKNQSKGDKTNDQSMYLITKDVKSASQSSNLVWRDLYPRVCAKLTQILNNNRNYSFQKIQSSGSGQQSFNVCSSK